MARSGRHLPELLLLAALLASAALLLGLGSELTYFGDSWAFLLRRPELSAAALLEPHNEHISVFPVAIQRLVVALFGIGSDLPERVLLTAMLGATAALLYVYARRRVGPWVALLAAVALLFLGPAWEVLLWPFEISLVGSVLFGLVALLALERGDRAGDLGACVALCLAIGFSSLGVPFAVGAAAEVAWRRRERGWRRLWIVAVPAALYLAWYATYGRDAESAASVGGVLTAPVFAAEGIASSVAALLGLRALADAAGGSGAVYLGLLALLALAALGAFALWGRRDRVGERLRAAIGAGLLPALAATLAFWCLAGVNELPGRAPWASRYMHVGAVLVLLVAVNVFAGVRPGRRALAALAALTAITVALNAIPLLDGYDRLRREAVLARADTAALEIARPRVDPEFWLRPEIAGTDSLIDVAAGRYFAQVDRHGSPAYGEGELAAAPEEGRTQADEVLAAALPVTAEEVAATPPGARCRILRGGEEIALGPGPGLAWARVPAGDETSLDMRRFALTEHPVDVDPEPGTTTLLRIPPDRSPRPWRLASDPGDPAVRICRPPAAG